DIGAVAISPDGQRLALSGLPSDSVKGRARVYDMATARPVGPDLEHQARLQGLLSAFTPDGQFLLTGSGDHTARLWALPDGKPLGGPLTHPTAVTAVAVAADGRHLATAQRGGLIRIWSRAADDARDCRIASGTGSKLRVSRDGRFVLPTGFN